MLKKEKKIPKNHNNHKKNQQQKNKNQNMHTPKHIPIFSFLKSLF